MVLTTFLISFILAMTSAGFPYSANPSDPRVQRHRVVVIVNSHKEVISKDLLLNFYYFSIQRELSMMQLVELSIQIQDF